jgi:hypothetical protein
MSEEDRYNKPSFEAMDAGIEFSNEAYTASSAVITDELDFETKYMEFDANGNITLPKSAELGIKVGTDFRIQQEAMKLSATAKLAKRHDERQLAKKNQRILIQPVPLASASKEALVRQTTLSPKARFSTMIAEQQILSEHMQLCEEFELT